MAVLLVAVVAVVNQKDKNMNSEQKNLFNSINSSMLEKPGFVMWWPKKTFDASFREFLSILKNEKINYFSSGQQLEMDDLCPEGVFIVFNTENDVKFDNYLYELEKHNIINYDEFNENEIFSVFDRNKIANIFISNDDESKQLMSFLEP